MKKLTPTRKISVVALSGALVTIIAVITNYHPGDVVFWPAVTTVVVAVLGWAIPEG